MSSSTTAAPVFPATVLADRFAPRYDAVSRIHLVVEAGTTHTFAAARGLDLLDVRSTPVNGAMWVRALPARWRRRKQGPPRRPTRLTLDDLAAGTEWVVLDEASGREVVLGVAGRFWRPTVQWREVAADHFVDFDAVGYAKIVMSLSVLPYGDRRSLLTYDMRVVADDTLSRLKLDLYWPTVAPFVRAMQRAALRTIKARAEQAPPDSAQAR